MVENIPLWKVLPPNSIRVATKPLKHGPMGTFKIQPKATSYIFLLCWETKEILNVKPTNCRSKRKNLVKNLLPQISMLMVKINRKKPLVIVLPLSGIFSSSISLWLFNSLYSIGSVYRCPPCGLPTTVSAQRRDCEWEGGDPRAVPASLISRAALLQIEKVCSLFLLWFFLIVHCYCPSFNGTLSCAKPTCFILSTNLISKEKFFGPNK